MFGSRKKGEKGSILLIAIVVVSVISVGLVCCLAYQKDLGKMGNRRREQMRAFYVADIGIQRVIHWFNHPDEYTPDTVLFTKFTETESYFNASNLTRFTTEIAVPSGLLPVVYDANSTYLGELVDLKLLPPDPLNDPIPCIVKVQSVGKSVAGPPKTIMVYLNTAQTFNIECPAAIKSEQDASWGGQFNIYWGEVWAKLDITLPNLNGNSELEKKLKNDERHQIRESSAPPWDPWLEVKTNGYLRDNNGSIVNPTTDTNLPGYYQPFPTDKYLQWLYQHQSLDFPQYDYQTYKEYAILRGKYYVAVDDKNLTCDGKNVTVNEFEEEITRICGDYSTGEPNPDNGPYQFIFVDNPGMCDPIANPSGASMVTLKLSGSGPHSKGVLYIANNVELGGGGDCPTVTNALCPNARDCTDLAKVRHQGFFYCSGVYSQQGVQTFYGSVVAKSGFGSGGCPEVYYDFRLKNGNLMTTGSNVRRVLWRTY